MDHRRPQSWQGQPIASALMTSTALRDYRAHLRPGEHAALMCIACDKAQARIVHRYTAAPFEDLPPGETPMVSRFKKALRHSINGNVVEVHQTTFGRCEAGQ